MRAVLTVLLVLLGASVHAAQLRARWDAVTTNADGSPITDLAGYRVYYGRESGVYGTVTQVGLSTDVMIGDLLYATEYFFAVTAYDTSGNESERSNEASATTPAAPVLDTIPPHADILTPADGEIVPRKERLTILAKGYDNEQLVQLEIYVNESLRCAGLEPENVLHCVWQVPAPAKRQYRIHAIAIDQAKNMAQSAIVTVTSK